MKRILFVVAAIVVIVSFTTFAISNAVKTNRNQKLRDLQIKSKDVNLMRLDIDLSKLKIQLQNEQNNKGQDQHKIQDLEKQIDDTNQRLEQAQKDLQARVNAKQAEQQRIATATAIIPTVSAASGCTDAKSCIYFHESGNTTTAVNSIGCRGLGQDCNGQLSIVCPNWQTDYPCQDAFFTAYMTRRYGTWEHAWEVWQIQKWW